MATLHRIQHRIEAASRAYRMVLALAPVTPIERNARRSLERIARAATA